MAGGANQAVCQRRHPPSLNFPLRKPTSLHSRLLLLYFFYGPEAAERGHTKQDTYNQITNHY